MEANFNDIRSKEIINVSNGKILGRAIDIIFDQKASIVKGFSVPIIKRGFSLRKPDNLFISIQNIIKIGEDVILVDLDPNNSVESNLVPKVFRRLNKNNHQ